MTRRKRIVLITSGVAGLAVVTLLIIASVVAREFQPKIHDRTVAWLEKRFDCDVNLGALKIQVPGLNPFRLILTGGSGAIARVTGSGLVLRQRKAAAEMSPILAIDRFSFAVDLGTVIAGAKKIDTVTVQGMTITIPPKDERVAIPPSPASENSGDVTIQKVAVSDAHLIIRPKVEGKAPLVFDISDLVLTSVGKDAAMNYRAVLTNAKPRGVIHSSGTFGPWVTDAAGDTPLSGQYTFDDADLSIFPAIAGILSSTGEFAGTLSSIVAHGEASVPDFRLKRSGNAVPLTTRFEVEVDGSNGNTILRPVNARLGSTSFTTSGAVIRKDGDTRRTIALTASMPAANLTDVLRLAMKGEPFMEGHLALKTSIDIPPLTEKVKEKLRLDGKFTITDGHFLHSQIQAKLDALSRRGQGAPKNEEIAEVVSGMNGSFHMEDEKIAFSSLSFDIPGAAVRLNGNYDLAGDQLDFQGSVALDAKVSQTMTGWKRWALKPVDPFFAKNGAGTFLRIRIDGSQKAPHFGLLRGKPDGAANAGTATAEGAGGGAKSR